MSDLYEIDWKRLTDGIETFLPGQEAQDLLLFLETCVKRVEPCEHGMYDGHWWPKGKGGFGLQQCDGARLGGNDE